LKTLPTLVAAAIALAIVLAPLSAAAAGSITFSSPVAGATYTGSQAYIISGYVSPAPNQVDQVNIQVTNPSGTPVDAYSASVTPSTGAFFYSTAVGGSSYWVAGTYTIKATDSLGTTGSTTFTYTVIPPFNTTAALVQIKGILVQINDTISADKASMASLSSSITSLSNQLTTLNNSLTALTGKMTTLQGSLTTMQASLTTLSTQIQSLSTSVASLSTQVQAAQTAATAAQTAAAAAQTAASNAQTTNSNTQTYVLVVAVLAAITLVLVLAVLIRKLS
jgi:uncharacterized protein YoxC